MTSNINILSDNQNYEDIANRYETGTISGIGE